MSERLWGILVDSFGKILLPGLTVTIPLTAISFTLALIIAVAVALVQFAHVPVLQRLARFYIWVIRGTPVLVQLFVVFYGLPGVGILIEPFPAAVLVFSINEGAYCAETIRAALESVPKGQMEAGQCVGMSYLQVIRRIILPQAYVGADAHLGVGCIVNAGAIVDHNAHLGRGVHVAPGGIVKASAEVAEFGKVDSGEIVRSPWENQ